MGNGFVAIAFFFADDQQMLGRRGSGLRDASIAASEAQNKKTKVNYSHLHSSNLRRQISCAYREFPSHRNAWAISEFCVASVKILSPCPMFI